jgi:hypothetical protein
MLDGFRAQAATDSPPAPSARRTQLAMRRNGEQRLGASSRRIRSGKAPTADQPVCPQTNTAATPEKGN